MAVPTRIFTTRFLPGRSVFRRVTRNRKDVSLPSKRCIHAIGALNNCAKESIGIVMACIRDVVSILVQASSHTIPGPPRHTTRLIWGGLHVQELRLWTWDSSTGFCLTVVTRYPFGFPLPIMDYRKSSNRPKPTSWISYYQTARTHGAPRKSLPSCRGLRPQNCG